MKKVVVILAFCLILNIYLSSALYEIGYTCEDNLCVEGAKMVFDVKFIYHIQNIRYTKIELLNIKNNETIAVNTNIDAVVTPQQNSSFSLLGFLPADETMVEILSCFEITPLDSDLEPIANTTKLCSNDVFAVDIVSVEDLRCGTDEDCSETEYCDDLICKPLLCGNCAYILDHKCYAYECCDSKSCKKNQACIKNYCVELDCAGDEYLEDHECMILECEEDEHASEHKCIRLNCKKGEIIENHECKELRCGIFRKAEEYECVVNLRLILKMLLALGVTGVVLGIFYVKLKVSYQ